MVDRCKASLNAEAGPPRRRTLLRRLLRQERGATMVEFAIIAVPLFVLIFGIIEVAFIFWGTYELENATTDAARLIRTGRAQQDGLDTSGMTAKVCERTSLLANCSSKIRLDVRTFASFNGITAASPVDESGKLQGSGSFSYEPGGPGEIVLVTVFYEWPLINFATSYSLSNIGSGNRLLQASVVFRNEPFRNQ